MYKKHINPNIITRMPQAYTILEDTFWRRRSPHFEAWDQVLDIE